MSTRTRAVPAEAEGNEGTYAVPRRNGGRADGRDVRAGCGELADEAALVHEKLQCAVDEACSGLRVGDTAVSGRRDEGHPSQAKLHPRRAALACGAVEVSGHVRTFPISVHSLCTMGVMVGSR